MHTINVGKCVWIIRIWAIPMDGVNKLCGLEGTKECDVVGEQESEACEGDNKPTNLHLHAAATQFCVCQMYSQTMKKHVMMAAGGGGHVKVQANHEIAC